MGCIDQTLKSSIDVEKSQRAYPTKVDTNYTDKLDWPPGPALKCTLLFLS